MRRHRSGRACRRGFTLIELLVVIGIISVLMSMSIMVVTMVRERARRTQTSNRLREIVAACIVYRDSQNGMLWMDGLTNYPSNSPQSMIMTGGLFENLARTNELSGILFNNPINVDKINRPPRPYAEILAGVNSGSDPRCEMWAWSFAYDWTSPHNAGSVRPLVADRTPSIWGNKGSQVGYVDAHCEWLTVQDINVQGHTWDYYDAAGVRGEVISLLASVPDNIYMWGEVGGERPDRQYRPLRGSTTLAWLR